MSLKFLNCKGWHPSSKWNQKKIFVAEEKARAKKEKEKEKAEEVTRELEARKNEVMAQQAMKKRKDGRVVGMCDSNDALFKDKEVTFMYAKDPNENGEMDYDGLNNGKFGISVGLDGEGTNEDDKNNNNNEDDAVREFKRKLNMSKKTSKGFSMHSQRTKLEDLAGKKRSNELTIEEQVERFPFLKGAPVEGDYAGTIKVRFNPFNQRVRNVKCLRCNEWGHQSGDRECSLKDYNPHDAQRQKREDPLSYMDQTDLKPKGIILKSKFNPLNNVNSDDDDIERNNNLSDDDVDEQFIASLSSKERRALLKRLKTMSNIDNNNNNDNDNDNENNKHKKKKSKKKHKKHHKKKSKSKKNHKKRKRSSSSDTNSSSDSDNSSSDVDSSSSSDDDRRKKKHKSKR